MWMHHITCSLPIRHKQLYTNRAHQRRCQLQARRQSLGGAIRLHREQLTHRGDRSLFGSLSSALEVALSPRSASQTINMTLPALMTALLFVILCSSTWPTALSAIQFVDCSLTFAQLDGANNTVRLEEFVNMPALLIVNQAVTCPTNCTSHVAVSNPSTTTSASDVSCSFPYSPSSSICLAAIHAGIISNATGGGVFVSRFYRHDWSNSSSQTIYPFEAWRGSLSNGVLSGDVDESSYGVPAGSREWSYTVRGRGDFVVQRRQAPFSARSNHVHEAFPSVIDPTPDDTVFHVHLIIGGYNGTHYLNDVHMATAPMTQYGEDLTWYQLDDAPFSPRSDVLIARDQYHLTGITPYLIGGQTSHACGLYELGVCSHEVWQLKITVDALTGVPSITWTNRTALPDNMASRCGPGILSSDPYDTYLLVAGQLSYNDSSCSTPPITVNEQWHISMDDQTAQRLEDAPFSPRRWHGGSDTRLALVGGIRHLNVSRAVTGAVRLTESEVFADAWGCYGAAAMFECDDPFSADIINGTTIPSFSLPVPTAAGGVFIPSYYNTVPFFGYSASITFGGILPAAALEQWRNTRPTLDSDVVDVEWGEVAVNVTMVTQDVAGLHDVLAGRMQLPLSAMMFEAELNDPNGSYALGAGWVAGDGQLQNLDTFIAGYPWDFGASVALHERPRVFANGVDDSSWWAPLAASSNATRRPLLNFDLRRRDHSATGMEWLYYPFLDDDDIVLFSSLQWTSGGRSGSHYYNDIMLTLPMRCLSPTDPSYLAALGPVLILPLSERFYRWGHEESIDWDTDVAETRSTIVVFCPSGYHFEPPSASKYVNLWCHADGMWMDPEAHSVRRCVRDVLNCTWPLVDIGLAHCQPTPPVVNEVSASYVWNGTVKLLDQGGVDLTGVPPFYDGDVTLTVRGSLFCESCAHHGAGI